MAGTLGRGLAAVPAEDLVKLLRLVHQGHVAFPLTRVELLVRGMNRLADHADVLVGLDEAGVRAVIVAVLAERRHGAQGRRPS
ncbi:MAG: hypothetical protein AAF447_04855 [Myxococcota bacterium]